MLRNGTKGLRLPRDAEAYGSFEMKWSERVVAKRGTNGAEPCNVME